MGAAPQGDQVKHLFESTFWFGMSIVFLFALLNPGSCDGCGVSIRVNAKDAGP
jgi:hypothetical protein